MITDFKSRGNELAEVPSLFYSPQLRFCRSWRVLSVYKSIQVDEGTVILQIFNHFV